MFVTQSRLAVIRRQDGGTVALTQGATVPDEVDPDHLERLRRFGAVVETTDADPEPQPDPATDAAGDEDGAGADQPVAAPRRARKARD